MYHHVWCQICRKITVHEDGKCINNHPITTSFAYKPPKDLKSDLVPPKIITEYEV